jgi:hypothetical protein
LRSGQAQKGSRPPGIQNLKGVLKRPLSKFWLPMVDEFRNFLMSEEADILVNQIQHFGGG